MDRRTAIGIALLACFLLFTGVTAALPNDEYRVHETDWHTPQNHDRLEQSPYYYDTVSYEKLSERGQEIYLQALRTDGTVRAEIGNGVAEWPYERSAQGATEQIVVVERPTDGSLPPASEGQVRYDGMQISTRRAEFPSQPYLDQAITGLLAIVSLFGGAALLLNR